jgi:hypothetical protein
MSPNNESAAQLRTPAPLNNENKVGTTMVSKTTHNTANTNTP